MKHRPGLWFLLLALWVVSSFTFPLAAAPVSSRTAAMPLKSATAQPETESVRTVVVTRNGTGGNQIQAIYSGDSLFTTSSSAFQNVQIDAMQIATAVSSEVSPASVAAGQPETLTALVAGEYTPPPGTVTFSDQHGVLGTVATTGQGSGSSASLVLTNLSAGSHTVTAAYSGDATFTPATSSPQTVTVTSGISTTSALMVSAATIAAGQPEMLTITVTPAMVSGMQPDGSATYMDTDGSVIGTSYFTGYSSTSQFTTSSLSVGRHSITVVYSGDQTYAGSTSPAQIVTVTGANAGTSTTLGITPATTPYRTPVTFQVHAAAGVGQVILCDAAAPQCSVLSNLGVIQINSDGNGRVKLPAGSIGTHSYFAMFLGTAATDSEPAVPAGTSVAVNVTVTGTYSSTTTVSAAGTAAPFTLTGTVIGVGSRTLSPTGQVSFNDTSNSSSPLLGMASLGTGTVGYTAVQPAGSPVAVGSAPYAVAAGDFNGDGFMDFVTGNYYGGNISVVLGKGDGTFQPAVSYAAGGAPERVLVADFNGDGIPDIVVANTASGTVSVLLGNGDGTFQNQVTYGAGSAVGLGILDLNHDGYPDIAVGDYYNNTMSVLINNGDGTFQDAVTYPTGNTPQTLAEGDFNGDGNIDIVVGNLGDNNVGVFLGNGDGTFQSQITYAVGSAPQGVQVGDFNGDGKADLAVVNSGGTTSTVSILLGNGDGTFQTQVTYPVGVDAVGLVVADFNGDGNQDIAVGNTDQSDLTESYLLGNGDGTFQPQIKIPAANFPYGEAAADFNGDGYPDLAISAFNSNEATILLSQVTETATATLANAPISGTGVHNLDAVYAGDTSFNGSTSPVYPFVVSNAGISPGSTTTVANGGIAPGSPTDYTFFGNMNVEFGMAGGGQPTKLTNFTVSTLSNVEYPGNGKYTSLVAPGGTAPFTTGTLTENPTNYPNTMPHTTLLATFIPLTAGSFTVYILDGNTDGLYVGNSSVGLGVNGGAAITSASHVLSGTNEFTAYTVTNAATTDVFQVYATTSTNAYPTIGALTFSTAVAALASSSTTLTATPTTQTVGGSVSLSVAVAGLTQTTPAATGTVTLTNTSVTPNVMVGTISLGAAGTGSLRTTALPRGTNVIVASYSGDGVYATSASAPQTVVITGSTALTLTAVSPNSGAIGSPATTVTLTGTNFAATDVVLYNATVLTSAFVNATTITAVIPASVFTSAGTGMITVRDTQTEATSSAVTFTVSTAPQIVFTGPPSAVSGQQPTLQFQLVNPYPVALTGSLTLTFVPSDSSGINDPAVQFASGGRTINFSIPADSTATPGVQLQTGTVAGTATVSLAVDANGVNVTPANVAPVTITIPAAAPTITSSSMTRTGETVTVSVVGFSNTREAVQATFHFTAVAGATIDNPDVTLTVGTDFSGYYVTPGSDAYGSAFTYNQVFTLDQDAAVVQNVTVTLTNTIGSSAPSTTP